MTVAETEEERLVNKAITKLATDNSVFQTLSITRQKMLAYQYIGDIILEQGHAAPFNFHRLEDHDIGALSQLVNLDQPSEEMMEFYHRRIGEWYQSENDM